MVLRCPECHIFAIIHYVAFTDRFHSLSEMHLKFPHVSSWLESSLPFSWIIVRCLAAVGLFIHSHHTWLAHRWHVGSVVTEALGNNQTKAGISWRNVSHAVRWVGPQTEATMRPEKNPVLILHSEPTQFPANNRARFYMSLWLIQVEFHSEYPLVFSSTRKCSQNSRLWLPLGRKMREWNGEGSYTVFITFYLFKQKSYGCFGWTVNLEAKPYTRYLAHPWAFCQSLGFLGGTGEKERER